MAYIIAIATLLSQAYYTGIPNPAQTVQGNADYRQAYIEQGTLPGYQPQKVSIARATTKINCRTR